jgi:2'-5' RNA ligase
MIEVQEVYGNNDAMHITIKGIGQWSNSEIRDLIEQAFYSKTAQTILVNKEKR